MDIHRGEKNYGRNDRASGGKEKSRTVMKGVFVEHAEKKEKSYHFLARFSKNILFVGLQSMFPLPSPLSRLSSSRQLGLDYQFFPRLDTVVAASPFARFSSAAFSASRPPIVSSVNADFENSIDCASLHDLNVLSLSSCFALSLSLSLSFYLPTQL